MMLLLGLVFLALLYQKKKKSLETTRSQISDVVDIGQKIAPPEKSKMPAIPKIQAAKLDSKECRGIFEANEEAILYSKDLDCVYYHRWGSYELLLKYSKLEAPVYFITLNIKPEELAKKNQPVGHLNVNIILEKENKKKNILVLKKSFKIMFSGQESQRFALDAKDSRIQALLLEALGFAENSGAELRLLSEATYEHCFHLKDPQQWVRREFHWTSSNFQGRVLVPKIGNRYFDFSVRGKEKHYECSYAN